MKITKEKQKMFINAIKDSSTPINSFIFANLNGRSEGFYSCFFRNLVHVTYHNGYFSARGVETHIHFYCVFLKNKNDFFLLSYIGFPVYFWIFCLLPFFNKRLFF